MAERQKKTPEQRAAEALGTAERVYAKAVEKRKEAREVLHTAQHAEEKAEARLKYVAEHPDLPAEVRAKYAAHFLLDEPEDGLQVVDPQAQDHPGAPSA